MYAAINKGPVRSAPIPRDASLSQATAQNAQPRLYPEPPPPPILQPTIPAST